MKKGITTLLILFATTVAAFSQSVESISYYEKNPSLGGDVKILKCTKSITEAQTFTKRLRLSPPLKSKLQFRGFIMPTSGC